MSNEHLTYLTLLYGNLNRDDILTIIPEEVNIKTYVKFVKLYEHIESVHFYLTNGYRLAVVYYITKKLTMDYNQLYMNLLWNELYEYHQHS